MIGLILAGGSGTRLQSVVKDRPKPLAEVLGRPFIRYLSDFLFKNGCKKLYISCFYLANQIFDEYKSQIDMGLVEVITEHQKLGTGGAIFYCLKHIQQNHSSENEIVILNGDSFTNFNPNNFIKIHRKNHSSVTILSAMVENTGRYGTLDIKEDNVISFKEKHALVELSNNQSIKIEPINAGVYAVNFNLLNDFKHLANGFKEFSFETEVLVNLAKNGKLKCCITNQGFLDIGIPSDYAKAGDFLTSQGLI